MIGEEGHWQTERVIDLVEVAGGENAHLSRPVTAGSAGERGGWVFGWGLRHFTLLQLSISAQHNNFSMSI